jgi:hypothetical protein
MFTNTLLALGFLVAVAAPPDVSKLDVLNHGFAQCPDGSVLEITTYDVDPNDPEAAIRVFASNGQPLAALVFKTREVYIYKDKKFISIDELRLSYPSPCDIPHAPSV